MKKSCIYTSFQGDYPLKNPGKHCATFNFVNNWSSRHFLHVWRLVLIFIEKELPISIGATQTIQFIDLTNQNCWYILKTWSFYTQNLWQNLVSLVKYETNILTGKFVVETPTVSLTLNRQDHTFHQICPFHMDDRQQNSMVNKDPGSFLSQLTHRSTIIVHYCSLEQHKSGVLPLKPSKKA